MAEFEILNVVNNTSGDYFEVSVYYQGHDGKFHHITGRQWQGHVYFHQWKEYGKIEPATDDELEAMKDIIRGAFAWFRYGTHPAYVEYVRPSQAARALREAAEERRLRQAS